MNLAPREIEARLDSLIEEMYAAQKALAEARDVETAAEIEYKRAKARTTLRQDCPKPTRGGYTTADKEAWIDEQVMDQWVAYKIATTAREVAVDNIRVVFGVTESVRSLNASARQAYSTAGA
jgi:hypothetical protein